MIRTKISPEEIKRMNLIPYTKAELNETDRVLLYDPNPTPIQRLIERNVTGGRGYLNLSEALRVVNEGGGRFKLTLADALMAGIAPIYFEDQREMPENPCGEIPLVDLESCQIRGPEYHPTLVERLEMIKRIKWDEECRIRGRFS